MDGSLKVRYAAECKAMRAYYHFNLVRMFGNVPLMTTTITPSEAQTYPQSKPEDVYAQIEKDLKEAILGLPATINVTTEGGRWTKGGAQAMLGKVLLYEKKYTEAAAQLAQVNGTPGETSQYGYKLLTNFKDLWVHKNKFNTESIVEAVHTDAGKSEWWTNSWDTEGNICVVLYSLLSEKWGEGIEHCTCCTCCTCCNRCFPSLYSPGARVKHCFCRDRYCSPSPRDAGRRWPKAG